MAVKHCFLLAILVAVSLTGAARAVEEEDDVAVLTSSNFDAWVNEKSFTLVEFYAPWCGHCKSLAPEWSAAAARLKSQDPPVLLAKVDATQHEDLAQKFEVQGYPTIYAFRYGVKEEYNGPRDADGIVSYVEEQGPPSFQVVSALSEAKDFIAAQETSVIAFIRPPMASSKIFGAVKALSKIRKDVAFAVENGSKFDPKAGRYVPSEVGAEYAVEMGAVVFSDFGARKHVCNIKAKHYSKKTLSKCIKEASTKQEL